MSTHKKREGMSRFLCDVSLYVVETPKALIKYHKPPLPIITFGIVACGFVGQPFSNQLNVMLSFYPLPLLAQPPWRSCGGRRGFSNLYAFINKLTSVFYASVLLLIMNFVITLSK